MPAKKVSDHNRNLDDKLVKQLTEAIGKGLKDEEQRTPVDPKDKDASEPDIAADDAHLDDG